RELRTQYDEGNIGQLYRRQDEIGTPLCITVDYETLDDGSVTVRSRDSMEQERVSGEALAAYLRGRLQ
ncbi:MAG TPA: His/Gly/Thr/Pro-type tRNA ligase C-terminal domain-containing protein, partial [Candidatus Cybelea sp.]